MAYKLDAKSISNVHEAYKAIAELDEICRRGTSCGYDMTVQDQISQALRQRADAIRETFNIKVRE